MDARRLTLALLVVLACGWRSGSSADPLDDRLSTARAQAVQRFVDAAAWAADHRLVGARHRALRRVLFFDPDHGVARAALGYTRSRKDGRWIEPKDYREPADWDKDALPEYDRMIWSTLTTYRNDALVAVEEAGGSAGARADAVLDQLAQLLPDDEAVHKARGDVRRGTRWVLAETARALDRRLELAAIARRARDATARATRDPAPLLASWTTALRSAEISIVGTMDEPTCRRAVEACQGFPSFFAAVFGQDVRPADPRSYYLLRGRDEGADLFARSGETQRWSKYVAAGLGGGWMSSGEAFVIWNGHPDTAVEMAVRTTVDVAILHRFRHEARGWISEGVGRFLCRTFAGFTGPPIVSLDQTEVGKDEGDVAAPDGDWLVAARDVTRKADARRLVALLTMRLTAMQTRDSILAYALAAYLIEGVPEKAATFLDASVGSDDAESVVRTTLGFGVGSLLGRLRRFTDESAAPR